jgi:type I site-specific restriction endonuclease
MGLPKGKEQPKAIGRASLRGRKDEAWGEWRKRRNKKARRELDTHLMAAGWIVQDRDDLDLTAGRGVAVREFAMKQGFGFADYLLYVDRKAAGAVEAKPQKKLSARLLFIGKSVQAARPKIRRYAATL